MSTRSDAAPVFFEFPDFGFGPVSTSIALLEATRGQRDWHVISTGSALRFCRKHLPELVYHDIDTSSPKRWQAVLGIVPSGSAIVSNTNPEFAVWALDRGHRVGIVDTLDWMWAELPGGLARARFHLVQAFFGSYRSAAVEAGMTPLQTGPIVLSDGCGINRADLGDPTHAVIGFGGMHVPFDESLAVAYASWFLRSVLPVLLEEHATERLTVVAGCADLAASVPDPWARDPRLSVCTDLPRADYACLLRRAGHVLVAPGLATLFECADRRLEPFLQPGFSMSMVLQCRQVRTTGYPYVVAWPWLDDLVDDLSSMPEAEGVALVSRNLRRSIEEDDTEWLLSPLRAYLGRGRTAVSLDLPVPGDLPPAVASFRAALESLSR